MSAAIRPGFALVTHSNPDQTVRLCRRLADMFGDPPIVIHHDYSQCNLDAARLPSSARTVPHWIPTRWGTLSLVQAYLAALRELYASASPEWSIYLSGADYPVAGASTILRDLESSPADAWMDYRPLRRTFQPTPDAVSPSVTTYERPEWMRLAYDRYVGTRVTPYRVTAALGLGEWALVLRGSLARRLWTPFSGGTIPYGGDCWHTLNHRAAAALLQADDFSERLMRHYRRRAVPDESFYQTLLLNRPGLRIENNNRRYSDWSQGGLHPRALGLADLPAAQASGAHFARKFPYDPALYDAIDARIAAL